jgi:hypothetical protein
MRRLHLYKRVVYEQSYVDAIVAVQQRNTNCNRKINVTRHTSHVIRHTSHVTRHTSHVTRHASHGTCPLGRLEREVSGEGVVGDGDDEGGVGVGSRGAAAAAAAAADDDAKRCRSRRYGKSYSDFALVAPAVPAAVAEGKGLAAPHYNDVSCEERREHAQLLQLLHRYKRQDTQPLQRTSGTRAFICNCIKRSE